MSLDHAATVTAIEQLVAPLLQAEGMTLVDLHWGRRGKTWALTLFIEREGGVTLDDCQRISYQVGELIEVENVIEHAYTLEVSSPGLDRPLRTVAEYERFRGCLAKIITTTPIRGRSTLVGRLMGVEAETVLVEVKGAGTIPIPYAQIKHARLEVEF
ncbi:MAG: ribosome maturation factor RimP [Candidatus Entotheonellia bacterium]